MRLKQKISLLFFIITLSISAQEINKAYIDSVFDTNYKQHKFSGTILISQKGKIVFKKSYGKANYQLNHSFNDQTSFQIGSVSKQFTAFGILLLQQQRKLSVDDYVTKYLNDFPYPKITIRQLLTHTSGLPNFEKQMWKDLDTTVVNGNAIMLDLLRTKKYPLQWEPGEKGEYSDIGYCTLATLIEKVSGERFNIFMKKNIFEPASMKNTTAELFTDFGQINQPNLCVGYEYNPKTNEYLPAHLIPKNNLVKWLGGFYGDGSVVTTANDLLKWDKALYQYKIITKESMDLAMTMAKVNDGSYAKIWGDNYGFGWALYSDPALGKIMAHAGSQPGYLSKLIRCTDKEITVIILSNTSDDAFWSYSSILNHLLVQNSRLQSN